MTLVERLVSQAARVAQHIPRALLGRVDSIRAHPLANPSALAETRREASGGHEAETGHRSHLVEAVEWLLRAQAATPDDGFSRGYSIAWNPYLRARGWQPSYPETTGYIIPTLYEAARHLDRPELAASAERAARWEMEIQLPSGAVRGGVIGEPESPAVFNTGQVIFGWLRALQANGIVGLADAVDRAGHYLTATLDPDGHWRQGSSKFARSDSTAYNARTAWALAEAGARLGRPAFTAAASKHLRAVASLQHRNGWIPHCCLTEPARPLLHTLAYAIRGLLEGGRVLQDDALIRGAALGAEHLAGTVGSDGCMAGRFWPDWTPAVKWSCLTGQAQMANVWLRLFETTGERKWIKPVPAVLQFLKKTQNRTSRDSGVRGGIKGSFPLSGEYLRYEILNWATKFFVDALIRHERLLLSPTADGESSQAASVGTSDAAGLVF